jgi:hypothetical protein
MIRVKNTEEFVVDLSIPGTQAVKTLQIGRRCFVIPFACVLKGIYAKLGTAGVTNNSDYDVDKNGTTILSSTGGIRFATTAVAPNAITLTADPTSFAKGDVIAVECDAIATTPAVNFCLQLAFRRRGVALTTVDGIGADSE